MQRSRLAVSAAAVALLAGCATTEPEAEAGQGPLDDLFRDIYGDRDQDFSTAQQLRVEELIAECMSERGFEYTPDHSQLGPAVVPADVDVEWGTLEFAEEYGYGATTDPWGIEDQEPWHPAGRADPNQAYVDAMTEGEREAYYVALYGDHPMLGSSADDSSGWESAGCQGWAAHQVYETAPGLDDDTYAALQADMQTMWDAIFNDPRQAELNSAWAACMADAGYPDFAAVEDAANSIYQELAQIWAELPGEDEAQRRIAELTSREIELAVADFTCRDEIELERIQHEIDVEYQQEFYDRHRTELEAWREAALAERG